MCLPLMTFSLINLGCFIVDMKINFDNIVYNMNLAFQIHVYWYQHTKQHIVIQCLSCQSTSIRFRALKYQTVTIKEWKTCFNITRLNSRSNGPDGPHTFWRTCSIPSTEILHSVCFLLLCIYNIYTCMAYMYTIEIHYNYYSLDDKRPSVHCVRAKSKYRSRFGQKTHTCMWQEIFWLICLCLGYYKNHAHKS